MVAAFRPLVLISVVKAVFTHPFEHHINIGFADRTRSVQKLGADLCKARVIRFIRWRLEFLEVIRAFSICR